MGQSFQRLYRYIFWFGYILVLIATFIPLKGASLDKITLGPEFFRIRLDHLLHFGVYFLICIYYLTGQLKGFSLFNSNPLQKFILLVLFLAIITELTQLWIPARKFNVFDLLSNVTGLLMGVGFINCCARTGKQRTRRNGGQGV